MILQIVKYDNSLLREKSTPVDVIDDKIKTLVENMFETMYEKGGIGLAAIQVGIPKKLFIVDIPEIENGKFVMINPEILEFSKEKIIYEEGCLSFPERVSSDVERAERVIVEFTDLNGKRRLVRANGLLSVCIQHEYDHLNGILFIDRVSENNKKKLKI